MRSGPGERGALLLEMLLALGLFVVAALTISAAVDRGSGSIIRQRDLLRAGDLARSAMARLEAGLATPETLSGAVPAWGMGDEMEGEAIASVEGIAFDEDADESGWEIEVEREASEFEGLSVVRVTARRVDSESGDVLVEHTLHQLVRLIEEGAEIAGEEDELAEAAREGAEREARRVEREASAGGGGAR